MITGVPRLALKIVAGVVAALLIYYLVSLTQVWLTSRQYEPHRAGAIVVMGAAQYNGVPSPDLRARLDEAVRLYRGGYAKLVVVTGSKEKGDRFTESEAGRRYLRYVGLPSPAILQAGGDDSYQNLAEAAPQLRARDATDVLVVTDPYHEYRSMAIASDVGLTPSPTPTHTSPIDGWSAVPYFLKEGAGVAIGRVVGYQDVSALRRDLD